MQQAFLDIAAMLRGISKDDQIAGLRLTDEGWKVPRQ
jgi:hypothetical protein